MIRSIALGAALLLCAAVVPVLAQDAPSQVVKVTPVKLQVVIVRFDGDKKISSMPNELWVNVSDDPKVRNESELHIGFQVPVSVMANNTTTVAYKDVGNKVNCTVTPQADGRYRLQLVVDQSAVDSVTKAAEGAKTGNALLRDFRSIFTITLRDGQTVQTTAATDPATGEVVKVTVTLNVVK